MEDPVLLSIWEEGLQLVSVKNRLRAEDVNLLIHFV